MRIALPMRRTVFFIAMVAIALVILLPMRLVLGWLSLDAAGLSAREARGSVWFGRLAEARFAQMPLGDVHAGLNIVPLLTGRARVDVTGDDGLRGGLSVARHAIGIDDVTARVAAGQTLAPLPLASLDLSDVSVRFREGLCESANGLVKATLIGGFGGVDLSGGLTGTARCETGALVLPLASQSGMEALNFAIRAGGAYRIALRVQPADAGARDSLAAAGFAPTGDGYVLVVEGVL